MDLTGAGAGLPFPGPFQLGTGYQQPGPNGTNPPAFPGPGTPWLGMQQFTAPFHTGAMPGVQQLWGGFNTGPGPQSQAAWPPPQQAGGAHAMGAALAGIWLQQLMGSFGAASGISPLQPPGVALPQPAGAYTAAAAGMHPPGGHYNWPAGLRPQQPGRALVGPQKMAPKEPPSREPAPALPDSPGQQAQESAAPVPTGPPSPDPSGEQARRRGRSVRWKAKRRGEAVPPPKPPKVTPPAKPRKRARVRWFLRLLRSLRVQPFPAHCSEADIKRALRELFGQYGDISTVEVRGSGGERHAVLTYTQAPARKRALAGAEGAALFGLGLEVAASEENPLPSQWFHGGGWADEAAARLYVGNLAKGVTAAELSGAFQRFGEVLHTELQTLEGPCNRAYLRFSSALAAHKAFSAMDGKDLGGLALRVRLESEVRSHCVLLHDPSGSKSAPGRFTEETLTRHLQRFGPVLKVWRDRVSGKALALFQDLQGAENAVHWLTQKAMERILKGDHADRQCQLAFFRYMESTGQDVGDYRQVLDMTDKEEPGGGVCSEMYQECYMLPEASDEETPMQADGLEGDPGAADMMEGAPVSAPVSDSAPVLAGARGKDQVSAEKSEEEDSSSGEEAAEPLPETSVCREDAGLQPLTESPSKLLAGEEKTQEPVQKTPTQLLGKVTMREGEKMQGPALSSTRPLAVQVRDKDTRQEPVKKNPAQPLAKATVRVKEVQHQPVKKNPAQPLAKATVPAKKRRGKRKRTDPNAGLNPSDCTEVPNKSKKQKKRIIKRNELFMRSTKYDWTGFSKSGKSINVPQ